MFRMHGIEAKRLKCGGTFNVHLFHNYFLLGMPVTESWKAVSILMKL